ncbi:MAG: redox-sensing transcriptional repressor [Chloroflexota bacterium]|nr:redox-sensing transcriptional repressor [Chloroflexota bacterium]
MVDQGISKQTLQRLPFYLGYLKTLDKETAETISATTIAEALSLNHVQVRKDLASVCSLGRPKIGYVTQELIGEIEHFLGYDNAESAVIVGAGKLGKALLGYRGFEDYGLNIVAAFDMDERVVGSEENSKQIFPMNKLKNLCERMKIHIGIITVPAEHAQSVCDALVDSGILAIWNFAPVHLTVPEHILVQNENMASSLAVLSKHLSQKFSVEARKNG